MDWSRDMADWAVSVVSDAMSILDSTVLRVRLFNPSCSLRKQSSLAVVLNFVRTYSVGIL